MDFGRGIIKVLEAVKKHLSTCFQFYDNFQPEGGVHVNKRPKRIRIDVIELNLLGGGAQLLDGRIMGYVNINYYHEDTGLIEIKTDLINDIMDTSLIDGYYFELYRGPTTFNVSKTLRMANLMYQFELPKSKYNDETGLAIRQTI